MDEQMNIENLLNLMQAAADENDKVKKDQLRRSLNELGETMMMAREAFKNAGFNDADAFILTRDLLKSTMTPIGGLKK